MLKYLNSENKILINPEDEGVSGRDRDDIENYLLDKNFVSDELRVLLYNYYLYYFTLHNIFDPLVNRADNIRFDLKKVCINIIKPNQFKYFNYSKYLFQFLICLKSPDEIFFRNSIKNGRISFFNGLFLKPQNLDLETPNSTYVNSYYTTLDLCLKPKEFLLLNSKNHSYLQYPFFNINGNENNKYIYLSLYLN